MKTCNKCLEAKPLDAFAYSFNKDHLRNTCKKCTYKAQAAKRGKATSKHLEQIRKSNKDRRNANVRMVLEYLLSHPCVDCGERDVVLLEFDHVTGTKKASVSRLAYTASGDLLEEIGKCEVRCVVCHRRKTAKDYKWYQDFPDILERNNLNLRVV